MVVTGGERAFAAPRMNDQDVQEVAIRPRATDRVRGTNRNCLMRRIIEQDGAETDLNSNRKSVARKVERPFFSWARRFSSES